MCLKKKKKKKSRNEVNKNRYEQIAESKGCRNSNLRKGNGRGLGEHEGTIRD